MKVCYVISTPSVAGGANRSLLDLIVNLKNLNEDFSCIALMSGHGSMETALQELGIKCYVQKYANGIKSRKWYRTLGKRIYNQYAAFQIKKIFETESVDIVHNNSLPTTVGMEVALGLSIPYICHVRENIWDGLGMEFYSTKRVQNVVDSAAEVIFISEFIKKSYNQFIHNRNNLVLFDGIAVSDYYEPHREILKGKAINLLIVGVINPQKGQEEAVKAAELLTQKGYNIHLTILGAVGRWNESTDYADKLKEYVKQKRLDFIEFMPPIDSVNDLKALRAEYDINLICSSAEGLGRTTIESMLSGALTIAADAGATPEIIKDNNTGLLYKKNCIEDLCNRIEWACKHKDKSNEIAARGQRFALEHFDADRYAKQVFDIYRDLRK